ncbi:hypothetical protein NDU88_003261 [Pleurodeles waltl]|uniref:Uncharacterized protein n=1 Tax=Pleurodeles waltl TaxID=8319 RepID=A0AAV7VGV5_PLEWA|nr:hypothetical protein NDU88_003261 [Pleurodeles waltl]
MLPRSYPSYPRGINTRETPNPQVLRAETNQVLLLGDGRQKQPLRAVTWIKREEKDESKSNAGTGGKDLGGAAKKRKRSENYNGDIPDGSSVETIGEDLGSSTSTAGHRRGPGGTKPELRPRSGKSVAIAGAWATHTRNREVEGMKEEEGWE